MSVEKLEAISGLTKKNVKSVFKAMYLLLMFEYADSKKNEDVEFEIPFFFTIKISKKTKEVTIEKIAHKLKTSLSGNPNVDLEKTLKREIESCLLSFLDKKSIRNSAKTNILVDK